MFFFGGGVTVILNVIFMREGWQKFVILPWKSKGVVGRVAQAKSSDPATPPKFGTCTRLTVLYNLPSFMCYSRLGYPEITFKHCITIIVRYYPIKCPITVSLGGGCFHPPFHNSFVFKVRLLKFCTELLSDRMNNLLWKKSESNQQWRHYDVTVTSYFSQVSINSAKKSLFWNSCCFSIFHSILLKFGRNILNT